MRWRIEPAWRSAWVVFVALVLLALVIRLAWLGRKSLWLDEVYSLSRASLSVPKIIEVRGDPHPPLFYIGLHYWLALGRDEFILRLPSAVWGALSVGLVYLLGKRWAGAWTGITSAILLAVAPLHVWYSQEARMYSLSCALGLLAVWWLSDAVTTGRRLAWLGWVLATTLGLYTHYMSLALLLVQLVMLGPVCYWLGVLRHRVLPGTLALVGVLLLYRPWLQRLTVELDQVINGILWYFTSVANLLATHGTLVTTRQLFTVLMVVGLIGVALLQLLAWKVASVFKRRKFSFGVSIVIVMSMFYLVALVASVWPRGYSLRRQVLIFVPYFLLMVAWGIRNLKWRMRLASGLVAVSLPFLMVSLVFAEQQDWRSLAVFMTEQAQPEDVILFSASYYVECMEYYYRGNVERVGVSQADVPSRLSQLTQKRARVWLVLMADVSTDPGGAIPAWLSERRSVVGQYSFAGVHVWLYGAPG